MCGDNVADEISGRRCKELEGSAVARSKLKVFTFIEFISCFSELNSSTKGCSVRRQYIYKYYIYKEIVQLAYKSQKFCTLTHTRVLVCVYEWSFSPFCSKSFQLLLPLVAQRYLYWLQLVVNIIVALLLYCSQLAESLSVVANVTTFVVSSFPKVSFTHFLANARSQKCLPFMCVRLSRFQLIRSKIDNLFYALYMQYMTLLLIMLLLCLLELFRLVFVLSLTMALSQPNSLFSIKKTMFQILQYTFRRCSEVMKKFAHYIQSQWQNGLSRVFVASKSSRLNKQLRSSDLISYQKKIL